MKKQLVLSFSLLLVCVFLFSACAPSMNQEAVSLRLENAGYSVSVRKDTFEGFSYTKLNAYKDGEDVFVGYFGNEEQAKQFYDYVVWAYEADGGDSAHYGVQEYGMDGTCVWCGTPNAVAVVR